MENNNKKDEQQLMTELFENKEKKVERKEGQLWEEGDGSQSKMFKNVAFGSLLAGLVVGGILVYFFGRYM